MIERLFSALTDNSLAHQCVDVQESLLHQMHLSGGQWVGVSLGAWGDFNGGGASEKGHFCHVPLTKCVFVSANPQQSSLLGQKQCPLGLQDSFSWRLWRGESE